MDKALRAALDYMGGELYETGGGCTAIRFDHGPSETLITSVAHEYTAPESLDEQADAYTKFKDEEDDGTTGTAQRATVREILLDIYGPIEGETLPPPIAALRD